MEYVYCKGVVYSLGEKNTESMDADQFLYMLRNLTDSSDSLEVRGCSIKDCRTCKNYYGDIKGVCDCLTDPTVPFYPEFCFKYERAV